MIDVQLYMFLMYMFLMYKDVPDVVYMLQRQSYTYNGNATVLECSSCASGYHCVDLFVFYMQMITITRQVLCKDICTL